MSDTNEDVALYAIDREIRRSRAPKPCDKYEASSREVAACVSCGWDHYMAYYQVAPDEVATIGCKYLSVDTRTGEIAHLNELPEGADIIGPTEGNA